jgi:universal stress protein A
MEDIRRILVVSESTNDSRKVIHYGVSLARQYGAELYIIHFVQNPFGHAGWNLPIPSLKNVSQEYGRIQELAKAELDALIDVEKTKGLLVTELIGEGDPTDEVLKVVGKKHIDLIVMLAPGRRHLEDRLFGYSRAETVRKAPCSVLLVRQGEKSTQ